MKQSLFIVVGLLASLSAMSFPHEMDIVYEPIGVEIPGIEVYPSDMNSVRLVTSTQPSAIETVNYKSNDSPFEVLSIWEGRLANRLVAYQNASEGGDSLGRLIKPESNHT